MILQNYHSEEDYFSFSKSSNVNALTAYRIIQSKKILTNSLDDKIDSNIKILEILMSYVEDKM